MSKSEVEKRTKLYSAKHMEKIRHEIKTAQSTKIYLLPFYFFNVFITVYLYYSVIKVNSVSERCELESTFNVCCERIGKHVIH